MASALFTSFLHLIDIPPEIKGNPRLYPAQLRVAETHGLVDNGLPSSATGLETFGCFFGVRACRMGYHRQVRIRLGMGGFISFSCGAPSLVDLLLPSMCIPCYLS
jgi:hypothetical protein